jgi:NADH-quinone oxidoreductase subunit L
MFLALGSATWFGPGEPGALVTVAVVAAIFHLFTHAFFKALLFLAAGSVMHAMGNVMDMRRFGGLRYALPTTHWTFLCGAAALAGFPLLSGFWSKDDILGAVWSASEGGSAYAGAYTVLFFTGLVTAGLTAFYTFRAYFRTFWGELRIPHEAGEHAHESPRVMLVPLIILACGAVLAGWLNAEPLTNWFGNFLERTPYLQPPAYTEESGWGTRLTVMIGSTLLALGGIGLAWWMYVLQPESAGRIATAIRGLYQLALNKFYLDELYDFFLVRPMAWLADAARIFDNVIDGLVDLIGQVPRFVGLLFRPIQNGLAQFYALGMALGMVVFLLILAWRYTG